MLPPRSALPTGADGAPIGLALPTLRRRLAAIAGRHATEELETPTDHPLVRRLLRRFARTRGTAQKKEPLVMERIPAVLMAMQDDLPAARDRALLLLIRRGVPALRNSSRSTSRLLRFSPSGLYVWIAAAKNDSRNKGASSTSRACRRPARTPNSARSRPCARTMKKHVPQVCEGTSWQ